MGCIPDEVTFQWTGPQLIDLHVSDDPMNIYTIEPLTYEPSNIDCPVMKYEIVPSDMGSYINCDGPIINP